jgi:hypothetical protein
MKNRTYVLFWIVGFLGYAVYSGVVANTVSQGLKWYHFPQLICVWAGLLFGSGGENINGTAMNVAFWAQCIVSGFVISFTVFTFSMVGSRKKVRNAQQ